MPLPTTFSLQPGQKAPTGNRAHQGDTVFLPFAVAEEWPEQLLSYTHAEKLAKDIDLPPGGRAYAFVNGSFIFGDLIEALIVEKNYHVKRLLVTALSIKSENVDSLRNLLAGDYVDALGLLISDYNFHHNRYDLMPYLVEQLNYDGRLTFAAARNHCKVCLMETHCGRKLVLHGSANLVSSGNIEQFCIEDNAALYDFNFRYLSALLRKYTVLNAQEPDIRKHKPLTKAQTWHPVPPNTATSTSSAPAAEEA
ncbi:hypothetical protein [Hymenobacter tenuis]